MFTIEMDGVKIKQAPTIPSFIEIFRTYHRFGAIVNKVPDFMRERGYNAHAGPAIGGDLKQLRPYVQEKMLIVIVFAIQ